ncbi:MAG: hypothetical protein ACE37K_21705 [Planctomycetota bacterium]
MSRPPLLPVALFAMVAVAGACLLAGWIAPFAVAPDGGGVAPPRLASGPRPEAAAEPLQRALARPAPTLAGRCVDWDTGAPIPGSEVAVVGGASAYSDLAGNWRIESADDAWAVRVRAAASGYLPVARTFDLPHRAAIEIPLRRAGRVEGLLLHADGAAPVGAVVRLAYPSAAERNDGWDEPHARSASVAADGTFGFLRGVPRGPVTVSVDGAAPLIGTARHVVEAHTFLDLRCRAVAIGEVIRGLVLGADGAPVPDALVHARVDGMPIAAGRTDRSGRFCLLGERPHDRPCSLTATCTRGAHLQEGHLDGVAWGSAGVTLQLEPGGAVALHVHDAATGQPIERYAVQCVRVSGVRSARGGEPRADGRHPGGWSALRGLAPGDHRLVVWPDDARWLPNLPTAFAVEAGSPRELRLALQPARPCRVLVVDGADVPVVGARVQLLVPGEHELVRDHRDLLRSGASRSRLTVRVATAATGADGVATLRWFDDPEPRTLRVDGGGVVPFEMTGVRLTRDGVVVRAAPAGLVDLRLRGVSGWNVVATGADGSVSPPPWSGPCTIGDDGRATLRLPAGRWDLSVTATHRGRRRTVSLRQGLRVCAGERVAVERDLRAAIVPATWTTRVLFDGQPLRIVELERGERGPDGDVRSVHVERVALDEHGRFVGAALPPGCYALHAPWTCAGQDVRVPLTGWVELGPAARRDDDAIQVATGRIDLELASPDGGVPSGGLLVLRGDHGCTLVATPDDRGRVRAARVPIGRYRLTWRGQAAVVDVGVVEVVEQGGRRSAAADRRIVPL